MNEELQAIAGSGGGGGCFRAGTQILQQNGRTILIELLKKGDEILSFDERGDVHLAKVMKVHYHEKAEPLMRVKFWNGEINITPNHWVLNQYAAFVEMGKLTTHDALIDSMNHLRPIISAEYIGHEPVWNLTVEPHHTFIADGIRVHNGGFRERFPTIAGSGGGGDSGKGGGRAAVEAPDTLQSRAMISILDLIGEGQIGGLVDGARSIYFDNTPIQNTDGTWNFSVDSAGVNGVTNQTPVAFGYQFRDGQQGQLPLSGYSDTESPIAVGIVVKKSNAPVVITITNPNADAVRVIVACPALISQDTTNGDTNGSSVDFQFKISINDGAYSDPYGAMTISGKTRSRYQRSYQFDLPKTALNGAASQKWTISLTRLTDDSTTSSVNNTLVFDSYVEIVNVKLSYPNSALIGLTIDSAQFSSIPTRGYLVNGLYIRVPSNYNETTRIYTGVWDGTFRIAVSNNPAWVMYDILTNARYGLGQFISASQVDKTKLYQIGKYCDELVSDGFGGMEPRFTINTAIQTQAEAYKLISDLSSVFRGMSYWSGGMIGFTQDSPADAEMIFTDANVIDGMFTYSGSARKDRHSVVLVTWNDPTQFYKQTTEYVEDAALVAKYGIRKVELIAFGCTSRGQANRVGKWVLYTESSESDMITFKVGMDAAMCLPGDIIKIHDSARAGKRLGGRLTASTLTSAILDAIVAFSAGATSTVSIRMADGTFEDRAILEMGKTTNIVTWLVPLPTLPVANAIWLVAEQNLKPMFARVIGISQAESSTEFDITALEHNPSKYGSIENGLQLEVSKTSIINPRKITSPTNFTIAESQYAVAPGLIGLKMDISWTGDASFYEVTWSRDGKYQTNKVTISTTSPYLDFENVRAGNYSFAIVAVNTFGIRSLPLFTSYAPVGKMTAPGDVANLNVVRRLHDLLITWDPVTDIGLATYEVRQGISWENGRVLSKKMAGTSITDYQHYAGSYDYLIRSINASGDYSTGVAKFTILLLAPQNVSQFYCVTNGGRIEFKWLDNPELNINGYEIREGTSWASSALIGKISATSYSTPSGGVGTRTFWIKAIASPDIYSLAAVFTTTAVAAPTNTNLVWSTDQVTLNFPGYSNKLTPLGSSLVMNGGASRSEYVFPVDLGVAYTAQNIIYSSVDSVVVSGQTWAGSAFAWASPSSNQQWLADGRLISVSSRFQIAKIATTLEVGDYDGWRLNGSLTSFNGNAANTSMSATYQSGRYDSQGLFVNDTTTVDWNVSIPSVFNISFWIIPKSIFDALYWKATGASGWLRLTYSLNDNSFRLTDGLGNEIVIPYLFAIDDNICIGIVQTATTRRLMIGRMGDNSSRIAELIVAPLGAFTKLLLY